MGEQNVKISINRGNSKWTMEFAEPPPELTGLVSGTITPEDFIEGRTLDLMDLMAVVAALRAKGMKVADIMTQVRLTIMRYDNGEFTRLGKGVDW